MGLKQRILSRFSGPPASGSEGVDRERRLAARERSRGDAAGDQTTVTPAQRAAAGVAAARSIGIEMLKLLREMLVIPAQLWLALAELAGAAVLRAWRRLLRPLLLAAWALTRAVYRLALRHVTPARATALVAVVAIAALAVSQWLDYRAVSVGTADYAGGFDAVAPAPEVDHQQAGDAHSWVMLPIAAFALAALAGSLVARARLAHLLIVAGAAAILISVLVDAPKGLDEGSAAVAYQGAQAHLLDGFWLQIVSGSVLIACGTILPHYLSDKPSRIAARGRGVRGGSRRLLSRAKRRRPPRRRVEGAST